MKSVLQIISEDKVHEIKNCGVINYSLKKKNTSKHLSSRSNKEIDDI